MSSYLTFYFVPKKSKTTYKDGEEKEVDLVQEPLRVLTYCRSSEIYQNYYHVLNPAYTGNEEKYTEITESDAERVTKYFLEEKLQPAEKRLESLYKIIKNSYNPDLAEDIVEFESELENLKGVYIRLKYISSLIEEVLNYSDFEKVLINID